MVQPMSGFSGFVTYMQYALGTKKGSAGGLADADPYKNALQTYGYEISAFPENQPVSMVADPFSLGKMTEAREAYTGQAIVEKVASGENATTLSLAWAPVRKGFFKDENGALHDVKIVSNGATTYANVADNGTVTVPSSSVESVVTYVYDNAYIPATQLPTMVGRMAAVALQAKVRRIAVYYSQLAAFQAKTDYGMDFESQIAQQAQAELAYEIDSEAVSLIKGAVPSDAVVTWTDLAQGSEHNGANYYSLYAEGLARAIEQAKAKIYTKTQRFMPNWMLIGPEALAALTFVKGFTASNVTAVAGPYQAGTYGGMKVFVSPLLDKEMILGVNGVDGKTSVGIYAPYMPIVPTQLLGFADGTMSQGFSTMYDMKILNAALLAKVEIVAAASNPIVQDNA